MIVRPVKGFCDKFQQDLLCKLQQDLLCKLQQDLLCKFQQDFLKLSQQQQQQQQQQQPQEQEQQQDRGRLLDLLFAGKNVSQHSQRINVIFLGLICFGVGLFFRYKERFDIYYGSYYAYITDVGIIFGTIGHGKRDLKL